MVRGLRSPSLPTRTRPALELHPQAHAQYAESVPPAPVHAGLGATSSTTDRHTARRATAVFAERQMPATIRDLEPPRRARGRGQRLAFDASPPRSNQHPAPQGTCPRGQPERKRWAVTPSYPNREHENADKAARRRAIKALDDIIDDAQTLQRRIARGYEPHASTHSASPTRPSPLPSTSPS